MIKVDFESHDKALVSPAHCRTDTLGFKACIERSSPNRQLKIDSIGDMRVKKIEGHYLQYVDEDGDWRRRYSKITFIGEENGMPKVLG